MVWKKDDDTDENQIEDLEYSRKSEFSKAKVVEEAIKKVEEMRSQEMREGYYNFITNPSGDIKKTYIPDSRKAYIGSVESLKNILSPEIKTNKVIQEYLEEFKEKKKKLFEKYSVERVYFFEGKIMKGEKYLPEVDEAIPFQINNLDRRGFETQKTINYEKGLWNYNVRQYWNEMVELYDELFSKLNDLVAGEGINFFKQTSSF